MCSVTHGCILFPASRVRSRATEGEGGSPAGLALDFDAAFVAGDDLFDHREPQPDAEAFRAIQRLEDFFQL